MARSECDVVVVGGGIAALAAAATARRNGSSVHLIESHRLGGRAQSDIRRGFIFNRGPHGLYDRGPGWAVLRSLGVKVSGAPAPLAGACALRGGRLFVLPTSPASLVRTDLLSPIERVSFGRIMSSLPRKTTPDLVALSAREWSEEVAARPFVRAILQALIRLSTYASDLDALSADAAVAQLRLSTRGVTYLRGMADHREWLGTGCSSQRSARLPRPGRHPHRAHSDGSRRRRRRRGGRGTIPGACRRKPRGRCSTAPGSSTGGPRRSGTGHLHRLWALVPASPQVHLGNRRTALSLRPRPRRNPRPTGPCRSLCHGVRTPRATSVDQRDQLVATAGVESSTISNGVFVVHDRCPRLARAVCGLRGRPSIAVAGTDDRFEAGDWVGGQVLLADAGFGQRRGRWHRRGLGFRRATAITGSTKYNKEILVILTRRSGSSARKGGQP